MSNQEKELTVESFLKSISSLTDTCGGCRFYNSTTNECREKEIEVNHKTPKCDKWRYFA
ncbi:hypothetical protein [Priestia megaterium]|uniref:hypothetical protein n=1 Tax=Priestia megaterium TaxID=1404 RepID=UPI0028775406|nr:hypothetical protein [Priestia megaterium]